MPGSCHLQWEQRRAINEEENMPEVSALETNNNDVQDAQIPLNFDKKPVENNMETKKESVISPPVLLPTRRRRSTSSRTTVKQKEPEVVARRNARERRRVKLVNDGFLRLRKHVPTDPKNKKLSKVKTLRSAIEYIRQLQQLLNQASKNPIQLTEVAKLEVLQGATGNGPNAWFPSLDLNKKDGQDYKEFEDAFFTPSRILPRTSLQL